MLIWKHLKLFIELQQIYLFVCVTDLHLFDDLDLYVALTMASFSKL
jgi:hypothetical protein